MEDHERTSNPIPTSLAMTRDEVSAMDLRNAAHHEAAHVVVAHSLGYEETAAVVLPAWGGAVDEVDFLENKLWRGKAFLPGLRPAQDADDARIIGLAGEVAVYLLDGDTTDSEAIAEYLEMEMDSISRTDRDLIDGYDDDDIDSTLALVRELWPAIEELAAELVTQGRRLESGESVEAIRVSPKTLSPRVDEKIPSESQLDLFAS